MNYLMKIWKESVFLFTVVAVALTFYSIKADAGDASKKASKFEETFEKIAKTEEKLTQIAQNLQSQQYRLKNWLLDHGEDSITAENWSQYNVGMIKDRDGRPLHDIPFLDMREYPEKGVLVLFNDNDSIVVLSKLWNYVREKD